MPRILQVQTNVVPPQIIQAAQGVNNGNGDEQLVPTAPNSPTRSVHVPGDISRLVAVGTFTTSSSQILQFDDFFSSSQPAIEEEYQPASQDPSIWSEADEFGISREGDGSYVIMVYEGSQSSEPDYNYDGQEDDGDEGEDGGYNTA
jgi:hypothetical protein